MQLINKLSVFHPLNQDAIPQDIVMTIQWRLDIFVKFQKPPSSII